MLRIKKLSRNLGVEDVNGNWICCLATLPIYLVNGPSFQICSQVDWTVYWNQCLVRWLHLKGVQKPACFAWSQWHASHSFENNWLYEIHKNKNKRQQRTLVFVLPLMEANLLVRELGSVYIIPDSYRRDATFVSDRGTVYITPELSDTRRSTNRSKNHFIL